jgi:hypothetical protein
MIISGHEKPTRFNVAEQQGYVLLAVSFTLFL